MKLAEKFQEPWGSKPMSSEEAESKQRENEKRLREALEKKR